MPAAPEPTGGLHPSTPKAVQAPHTGKFSERVCKDPRAASAPLNAVERSTCAERVPLHRRISLKADREIGRENCIPLQLESAG